MLIRIRRNAREIELEIKDSPLPSDGRSVQQVVKSMLSAFHMTKQRCYNQNCRDYPYYGGRGIEICQRWLNDPLNMLVDMGLRPEGLTLERKDNNGDYEPTNCVWATRMTQGQNTRSAKMVTHQGETLTLSEWERRLGMNEGTLKARLGPLGYSVEEAFKKEVKFGLKVEGRSYKVRRKPDMSRVKRGLDSPQLVLTQDDVMRARELHGTVGATYSLLAAYFGCSIETMSCAVQGQKAYAEV